MTMNKLRVEFFTSVGGVLIGADFVLDEKGNRLTLCELGGNREESITLFASRKNTGEQPCGDVPVVVEFNSGNRGCGLCGGFDWHKISGNGSIKTFKPDLAESIKMQNDHDSEQDQASKNLLNAVVESGRTANQLKEAIKMKEQLKYTPEMKSINATPEDGMKCRVEWYCDSRNETVFDEVTFRFELNNEFCAVDDKGCFGISKDNWIAWHCIDDRSELDITKEKQIEDYATKMWFVGGYKSDHIELLNRMQAEGMLAEIVLPLER